MNSITENSQKHNPVSSMFAARKQRFEQAIVAFNEWFLSDSRCNCDLLDSVEKDFSCFDVIEARQAALFATPARTLADVAFKVEQSRGDLDEAGDDPADVPLLDAAMVAIRNGNLPEAIRALESALDGETDYPDFYQGAAAALADLRRMEVQP